jgi:hypothetical protein
VNHLNFKHLSKMKTLLRKKLVFSKIFENSQYYDIDCEYFDDEITKMAFTEFKKQFADTSLQRSFVATVQKNKCNRVVEIFQIID